MDKNWSDKWEQLKEEQKKLASRYEEMVEEIASFDLIHENEHLKNQVHKQEQQIREQTEEIKKKSSENQSLRVALQEQILDEKMTILKLSRRKLDTYFGKGASHGKNRLKTLEREAKQRIDSLKSRTDKLLAEDKAAIFSQLDRLSIELQEAIKKQQERWAVEEKQLRDEIVTHYDQLASEEITEEMRQKRIKQNQIEMKIGLNWVNKIGILLILFGIGAASKYTYSTWFNDYMKGAAFFLLGALFLAGGEWFFRKKKTVFANGLLGGGISVLYGAVFYSYFLLDIITMTPALLISILVTATAIVFSVRHHSITICSLGLVGGYLPFFTYIYAFGLSGSGYYAAMGYMLLLNSSVLLVSFWKRWNFVHLLSFVFHMPSMYYLVVSAPSEGISILYATLTFLLYLFIVLAYPFKHRLSLKFTDTGLLAVNTLISCVIIYILMKQAGWDDFLGLLALVISLVYAGLGQFIDKVMRQEKYTMVLFYATSLTFAVLMIPFQFGIQWLSMGWLVEGLLLMIYGYRHKLRYMEMAGWGIFLLCIGAFYMIDAAGVGVMYLGRTHFDLKYSAVVAGMIVAAVFYLRERRMNESFYRDSMLGNKIDWFKYFALMNIWFYLLYEGSNLYDMMIPQSFAYDDFYQPVLIAVLTLAAGYAFRNISLLYDRVVKWISIGLFVIADLIFLYLIAFVPTLHLNGGESGTQALEYLSLIILIAFNLFVLFSFRQLLLQLLREKGGNIEWYPLLLGVFLWGNLTVFLVVQFDLGEIGLLFSLLYLVLAIGYILYGFQRRYVYIRRMGLGLALLSTSKLFLYDLSFLGAGSKIVAYFSFGAVLLGISFIYQRVSQKLEERDHVRDA